MKSDQYVFEEGEVSLSFAFRDDEKKKQSKSIFLKLLKEAQETLESEGVELPE